MKLFQSPLLLLLLLLLKHAKECSQGPSVLKSAYTVLRRLSSISSHPVYLLPSAKGTEHTSASSANLRLPLCITK
jgi:hypothetical protein